MSEDTDKTAKNNIVGKPFEKNDPRINRNGRPKGSGLNLTSLLKEKLEEIPDGQKEPYKTLFIKTLLKKALLEKDMQSMKLIMNYVDGLPKQSIDFQGEIKNIIGGFNYIKPEQDEHSNTDNQTDNKTE